MLIALTLRVLRFIIGKRHLNNLRMIIVREWYVTVCNESWPLACRYSDDTDCFDRDT
jgi:hypothetical protein